VYIALVLKASAAALMKPKVLNDKKYTRKKKANVSS